MHGFGKTLIFLFACIVCGYASQGPLSDSVTPLYANYDGLDLLSDVPWVINKDEPIPFFFIIKDCNQYVNLEFYCIAIYDISDGIKYYGGVEIVPSLHYTIRVTQDSIIHQIGYPPLEPNPLFRTQVPNQIFYDDWSLMGYSSPPNFNIYNWWKREVNTFNYVGMNFSASLNGTPITPTALGYDVGDTITFRTIMVCRKTDSAEGKWYLIAHLRERDFRVIVTSEQNPLPKISNWYLTDCHTHSWNTDDEWEYGGVTPFMAKVAKKIGLDYLIFTDHSNDCGWVQDHNDGWGSGTNWDHCGWEVNQYTEILLIRAEEISTHPDSADWGWVPYPPWFVHPGKNAYFERHCLGYNLNSYIAGWHPLTAGYPGALYNVSGVLNGWPPPIWTGNYGTPTNNVKAQGGFGYMAHPGSYYPDDSTTIISALKHSVCKGWQIFNCRKTHSSSDEMHPWGEFPYGQSWENSYANWFDEYIPIIRIWDRYMAKHLDSLRKKVLVIGGSDAHGDFNYSFGRNSDFPGFSVNAEATTLGAWRTAVYCPAGLTRDNILNGLKMGRTVVTDGPMMIFGLDMNNDGDIYDAGDLMIGDGDNNEGGW
uniref:Uncharacterized protein n=1 Tax=candidate division WOR-3 bacterium TaxID=2052148 RepID=A0A7V3RHE5_UNCW3